MNRVFPRPSCRRKQRIQTVRVRPLVGVRDYLAARFDEERIPADIAVRFAGERSEAPAFVELDVLDDIDAIGIGVGRLGLSK
jgi:hypothetical protein